MGTGASRISDAFPEPRLLDKGLITVPVRVNSQARAPSVDRCRSTSLCWRSSHPPSNLYSDAIDPQNQNSQSQEGCQQGTAPSKYRRSTGLVPVHSDRNNNVCHRWKRISLGKLECRPQGVPNRQPHQSTRHFHAFSIHIGHIMSAFARAYEEHTSPENVARTGTIHSITKTICVPRICRFFWRYTRELY